MKSGTVEVHGSAASRSQDYYPWFDWLRAALAITVMFGHERISPLEPFRRFRGQSLLCLERMADRRNPPEDGSGEPRTVLLQPRGANLGAILHRARTFTGCQPAP